jgi:hypothetical protein
VKHGGCLHNFLLVLQAMRGWVERRKGAKFCVRCGGCLVCRDTQ